jgi:bifunctional non-homologous end joining protein LigD
MSLEEYARKRDFHRTAEPRAARTKKGRHRRFVVQKHAASRLHYDFRLELGGALKSWAVPKGVPFQHGEKRLAMAVEDHPVSYIGFEGVIPKGEYGGGTVMVWDAGTFEPLGRTPLKDLAAGKLHFVLHGKKLEGEWHLVRMREGGQWLLIRGGEDLKPPTRKADDTSALSGKSMPELARGGRVWPSKGHAARLPAFVEPMKAKLVAQPPAGSDWLYEIKFDGYRALGLCGESEARLLSRNQKDLGAKFPDVLAALEDLRVRDAILDGEIVALDAAGRSSFQLLQAFELGDERPPLFYYAFDLLRHEGRDLRREPLHARKRLLAAVLADAPPILRHSASLGANATRLLTEARKAGLEGLIGKRANSNYEAGRRSGAWIKLKLLQEQEFIIGGYTEPRGSRKFLGALIVGVFHQKKLMCVGKVGTGFTEALLRSLHARLVKRTRRDSPFDNLPLPRQRHGVGLTRSEMKSCHWVEPELVCQLRFAEWTRDNRLRQPVFLGLREDKEAAEVARERVAA